MSKLTEAEMAEKLKSLGVDSSQWDAMGGGEPQTPEFARSIAGKLQKMNDLLGQALAGKQAEVRLLQEKLARLKYGGGS